MGKVVSLSDRRASQAHPEPDDLGDAPTTHCHGQVADCYVMSSIGQGREGRWNSIVYIRSLRVPEQIISRIHAPEQHLEALVSDVNVAADTIKATLRAALVVSGAPVIDDQPA